MKSLTILLSMALVVSCTITKRHFGGGYHVEWKKSCSSAESTPEKQHTMAVTEDIPVRTEKPVIHQTDTFPSGSQQAEAGEPDSFPGERYFPEKNEYIPMATGQQQTAQKQVPDEEEPTDIPPKKTEPFTIVSLLIFVGIAFAVGLIYTYSSFLYLGTGIFLAGLATVLFTCSLISLIRVYRNPDGYKNKWLTKIMFLLSVFSLVVAGIYLLITIGLSQLDVM